MKAWLDIEPRNCVMMYSVSRMMAIRSRSHQQALQQIDTGVIPFRMQV